jgi:Flp pilus assembly protein TadB
VPKKRVVGLVIAIIGMVAVLLAWCTSNNRQKLRQVNEQIERAGSVKSIKDDKQLRTERQTNEQMWLSMVNRLKPAETGASDILTCKAAVRPRFQNLTI